MQTLASFNPGCRACSRLSSFLDEVGAQYPDYHAAPVAPFGDADPDLLIVGLAPGMHGANATGRPFTGDYAGILLYETLYKFGFSNQPDSQARDDGLALKRCRITNAVKCLPPQNKPLGEEISNCNQYLANEISALRPDAVILALGSIAHTAVLRACKEKPAGFKFGHNQLHQLQNGRQLLDSYHCSRYNTQTRRLTEAMFHQIFTRIGALIKRA